MLLKKFLLLGLPVLAMAATSTDIEEEEDELTTTTKATSTSGFKTSITTTSSSSSSKATDDEEEEEEEEEVTVTTTSKGAKTTTVLSGSKKNSTKDDDEWPYTAFGDFIIELPECTRGCFQTPTELNITTGEGGNCAKADNWNCICHFYNPGFYEKVFNDSLPATTTTKSSTPRKTGSATTTTTKEPEATETPITPEELAKEDFFICLEDACGLRKWGNGRDTFFDSVKKLHTYCQTEEKTYDKERNDEDFAELKRAKEALEKKKKEEAEKNNAGKVGMGIWATAAVAALSVAFAL